MTCSPQQSRFVWANMSAPYPARATGTTGIPEVVYLMSSQFAQGMFDSCKDVVMPGAIFPGSKSLDILCGRPTSQCSPKTWLDFLGTTRNGQAPFPIKYTISDVPYTTDDKTVLEPMNMTNAKCSEPMTQSTDVIGKFSLNLFLRMFS